MRPGISNKISAKYRYASICLCGFTLICLGCEDSSQMKVYPANGTVLFKGEPAAGAQLAFYGLDDPLRAPDAPFPQAVVQADGSYQVSSYAVADGAPAGRYKVTIVWRKSATADPEIRDDSPDLLRGRYATLEASDITVNVSPTGGELPTIELK